MEACESSRYNIYVVVHKGLRAHMSHVLGRVGSADWDEAEGRAEVLAATRELLDICLGHLSHEEDFIHPAMEARRPGSASQTAADHCGHHHDIEKLTRMLDRVRDSAGMARVEAGEALYRQLAVFVAENFEHMEVEEQHNNAVLWSAYSDAEIAGIEQRLVASIPPQRMSVYLRWMLPHASPRQRLEMLADMRRGAPSEVFGGVMQMLQGLLAPRDWGKLNTALTA